MPNKFAFNRFLVFPYIAKAIAMKIIAVDINYQIICTAKTCGLFLTSLVTTVAILRVKNNPRVFALYTI